MTKIAIQTLPHAQDLPLPSYATEHSAGMDLLAAITEDVIILPHKHVLIKTGIAIALPEGYEAQVRPRSGLALKYGVTVLNTPGTIDADYRGEIGVVLINHSTEKFVVTRGARIAQMIIAPYTRATWNLVETLEESERGAGGFGFYGHTFKENRMIGLPRKIFYAMEAVVYVAYNGAHTRVSSKEIATQQGMPTRYLEQIMQRLVRSGILKGVRGPHGGYLLAREKRRITLADICRAVGEEEDIPASTTLGDKVILPAINDLQRNLISQLDKITISALCEQAASRNIKKAADENTDFTI